MVGRRCWRAAGVLGCAGGGGAAVLAGVAEGGCRADCRFGGRRRLDMFRCSRDGTAGVMAAGEGWSRRRVLRRDHPAVTRDHVSLEGAAAPAEPSHDSNNNNKNNNNNNNKNNNNYI